MEKEQFKYSTQIRVRNYEVDWQGIVHNAQYLLYFEFGRLEYLKHVGVKVDIRSIMSSSRVVLVRNEIDYESPATYDDLLTVHSRIAYLKNTSFGFEGVIEHAASGRRIASNVAIHVWLHPRTGEPMTVPEDFRRIIENFEGKDLVNLRPPGYA
jgi:acyl-CoA thioester hydrolase